MTSKEALERINEILLRYDEHYDGEYISIIKQDLERLEEIEQDLEGAFVVIEKLNTQIIQLEEENENLKNYPPEFDGALYFFEGFFEKYQKLEKENQKLKKALELACELLGYRDCPVEQELIDDLDCENRCSEGFEECCKECWKIYFLKEVLENE